jgi:GNAT superfamily N-acetyltransferase
MIPPLLLLLLLLLLLPPPTSPLNLPFLPRPRPPLLTISSLDYPSPPTLRALSDFFTASFWASKAGGSLTPQQTSFLRKSQAAEFGRRYRYSIDPPPKAYFGEGKPPLKTCAVIRAAQERGGGEAVVGMVGVEVDRVNVSEEEREEWPVMSNLSVGRDSRRQGIAELLVKEVERVVGPGGWGFPQCYLLVEKANVPAVKLYRKLG